MEPGQYLIYIDWVKEDLSDLRNASLEFEKANEIYFRLGIIYKQQHKYPASLDCFRYILGHPPRPLTEVDIWFQIGHVYEQQKDVSSRSRQAATLPYIDSPCICFRTVWSRQGCL
jgi:tetratricopeptide (TPR) repeat protein